MNGADMATVRDGANSAAARREGLLARYPLVLFFVLSFILTWGYFWLIFAPLHLPESLKGLGGFAPAISAFLVLVITSGKPGILRLLRSIVHWRVGISWYLLALLGIPFLNFLAFLVIPGALSDLVAPNSRLLQVYLSEMAISLTIGIAPLWEEIGWRGFALPNIQRLYGPVVGTLVLGALWGLWHLPFSLDHWPKRGQMPPSPAPPSR